MDSIDAEMKAFIESEVAVVVGTRDDTLVPEATFGWGPRVLEGGHEVEMFIDRRPGEKTIANLRSNGAFAATFASPISYLAVQLKGWCAEIGEAAAQDQPWIDKHREAFMEALRARGLPAHVTRNYWTQEVVRVRLRAEEYFNQTPGPGAGAKL
jgi:hypothetical protein